MSDHGHHGGIVRQLLRNADRNVGPAAIVHHAQHDLASANPAVRIDLFHCQLGGPLHRLPARLREGTSESQDDGSVAASPGAGSE